MCLDKEVAALYNVDMERPFTPVLIFLHYAKPDAAAARNLGIDASVGALITRVLRRPLG
jgi:hypothetical protein